MGFSPFGSRSPYDQTQVAVDRARAADGMNDYTYAQSRGLRPPQCGPTGALGHLMAWLDSPEAGILAVGASITILTASAAISIARYGPAAAVPVLVGIGAGAVSGAMGLFVQDMANVARGGKGSSWQEYARQAGIGALSGGAGALVGMAGASLMLPPAVTGAISGFVVGTLTQAMLNAFDPSVAWYRGVMQSGLTGAVGGAVGGAIAGRLLSPTSGLGSRMAVGGAVSGLVSGGTHVAMNVAAGRSDPLEGLGTAIAVGLTTGAVDAAADFYADQLLARRLGKRPVGADEADDLVRVDRARDLGAEDPLMREIPDKIVHEGAHILDPLNVLRLHREMWAFTHEAEFAYKRGLPSDALSILREGGVSELRRRIIGAYPDAFEPDPEILGDRAGSLLYPERRARAGDAARLLLPDDAVPPERGLVPYDPEFAHQQMRGFLWERGFSPDVIDRVMAMPDEAFEGLVDLLPLEARQIQAVVEEAGYPIWVVGGVARGKRRNVGRIDLPFGRPGRKGPNTRSDIDYWFDYEKHGLPRHPFDINRLPEIAPHGILGRVLGISPRMGPGILFQPGKPPEFYP